MKLSFTISWLVIGMFTLQGQTVEWVDTLPRYYPQTYAFHNLSAHNGDLVAMVGYGYGYRSDNGGFGLFRFTPDGHATKLDTTYCDKGYSGGSGTAVDGSGNMYTACHVNNNGVFQGKNYPAGTYLLKHNQAGKLIWVKSLPFFCQFYEASFAGQHLYLNSDCGIYKMDTAGQVKQNTQTFADHFFHTVDSKGMIFTSFFREVSKVQPDGKVVWSEPNEHGAYIALDKSDELVILEEQNTFPRHSLIKKFGVDGKLKWSVSGGNGYLPEGITMNEAGEIFIMQFLNTPGDYQHVLSKFDNTGKFAWEMVLPDYDHENYYMKFRTMITLDDAVYLAFNHGETGHGHLYKVIDLSSSVGLREPSRDAVHVQAFPNPSNGSFVLTSDKPITGVSVRNIQGQLVNDQSSLLLAKNKTELRVEGLPAGIYFAEITSADQTVIKKVIVK